MAQIMDPGRTFSKLKNAVTDGIKKTFPVETDNRIMTIDNVRVADEKISPMNHREQKELKMLGKDFVAPVYGDLVLKDKNTGQIIDKKKNFRIMDVPVLTDRYTYILGGNEYTVDKQLRMKPGIYTREKENGELESQFNMARGGGRGFKMVMDPNDGIFKLKIGTAYPNLYPILKALGVEDSKIKEKWGDKLFQINQKKGDKNLDKTITKAYKAVFQKDENDPAKAAQALRDFFDSTVISEETTQRTLGKGFAKVEPETLLLTSKRLLDVSRGDAEPDDRDSLVYKHIYDTPDLVQARIDASTKKVQNDIKRIMDKRNKVTEIVSKDMLNKPVRQFFVQGSVAHAAEQENPTTMLAEMTKVTSLGEGAIGDMNAITMSMRDVNTSHAGVLDPVATPESERIGINLHLALGANIKDKELQTMVRDKKSGKVQYENIKDTFDKYMAFPDQYDKNGKPVNKQVMVMHKGKITSVDPSKVDGTLVSPKQMFSYLSNMVPFAANVQGNRAFMANKMLAQAIPLKYREKPLVQTKMPTGGSFEKFIGNVFSTTADFDGTVEKVNKDVITVRGGDGNLKTYNLYDNFPLNNKCFIDSEVKVKPGDKVKMGQTLADTTYTKDGTLAIGTNLRVGIMPFRDTTFEDGYTISESAAKKLTSEHLREASVNIGKNDLMSPKAFAAHFPTAISKTNLEKLDEDGVVRVGQRVDPGDVLITHLQKTEASEEDARLGKLSKKLVKGYRNDMQIWDKDVVGTVTDVVKTPDGVKVLIRDEEPMQIGDKMVNRHGAKGIVSAIIPDKEMPMTKDGKHLDVIISPSAMPGRINPSQILETAAGKVAEKRGKPLKIDNFAGYNSVKEIKRLLKENGLTDKETMIDPTTGQNMGKVMVGNQYYLKLMHQVDKKINARGVGPSYDINLQPTKGGHTSARALDRLTFNSFIAHGARENLYEMTNYKAEKNPELWRNVQLGLPLPAPKTPFVFDKLVGYLNAGGVDVKKEGNKMYMMPMTDDEVLKKSNGEIEDAKVVVSKNLRPIQDGLFDENKTGGLTGNKWTHVHLAEPVLNPVMEGAALTLLDMTKKDLDELQSGNLYYDSKKKALTSEDTGLTAGAALEKMLSEVNVDKTMKELKEKSKTLKGQGLDKANKKMRLLRALQVNDMTPSKAYMMHDVPVLPPQFRPMYPLPNGSLNTAPINFLYRDMIMVNKQLKELKDVGDFAKGDLRKDLYQSVKAIQGIGDPLVQRGEKKIIGAIETIKGEQPKTGFFQSIVFSKNQDLSGSSTITPSTEISPDEILMPKDMAWNLYQPFVVKEMVSMGYKPLDASVMVRDRDPRANIALDKVSRERPVWLNRAPSLHKFSALAFQPKLYDGRSIGVHPTIVGGFGADFDGDSCIDAVFIKINLKKFVDKKDNFWYNNNVSLQNLNSITFKDIINMPSILKTVYTKDNYANVYTTLENFPRIEESRRVSEKGTIVYDVPDGVQIYTIDPTSKKPIAVDVTEFSIHPDLWAYTVEMNDGSNMILSSDHSAITWDPDKKTFVKTKPTELKGRVMPKVISMSDACGTLNSIKLIDYNMSVVNSEKAVRVTAEDIQLDEALGHFIGMMVGDGWVSRQGEFSSHSMICFANVTKELVDSFKSQIHRLIPDYDMNNIRKDCSKHMFQGYDCYSEKYTVTNTSLAGNIDNWICAKAANKRLPEFFLSAPREFREGLLAGLIDTDGTMNWSKACCKKNPQFSVAYSTVSINLAHEIVLLAKSLGIKASITESVRPLTTEYRVVFSTLTLHDKNIPVRHPAKKEALRKYQSVPLNIEAIKAILAKEDLVPMCNETLDAYRKIVGCRRDTPAQLKTIYTALAKGIKFGFISRYTAEKVVNIVGKENLPKEWVSIVYDKAISWVYPVNIKKLNKKITMYDITAPGPYTFMTASGIIVQDTMGVYVPVSHKAVEEAKQFMPTKCLEHGADGKIMVAPSHDIMTGLFYLTKKGKDLSKNYSFNSVEEALKKYKTREININDFVMIAGKKTTAGRELVKKTLPPGVNIPEEGLTKKTNKAFLKELSKHGSEVFGRAMDQLSKLSAKYDLYSEVSIGLDDLEPDYAKRDKLVKETQNMLSKAKTDDEKRKVIVKQMPKFDQTVKDFMAAHPDNPMSQLMTANGKPSFDQYKQLLSTPFAVRDTSGKAFPVITSKSYSEGLPVSEYWATSYGARTGMIQKRLETAEPGYFSKQILSVTIDNVISKDDCGTKDGVDVKLQNKNDVVGRYEAGTNRLIDEAAYTQLLKTGKKTVKLRSPLTCMCAEGTCSKCYGLRENGQAAKIGDNIGALAGQFFTEPTTQGSMKAFHSGAVLGAGAAVSEGLDRLKQLTLVPEYLKDKATLAKSDGRVDKIEDNPAGGKFIYIDGERHLTGPRHILKVKVGSIVKKGDALTDGPIKPQELMELKGVGATQEYLVDSMQDTLKGMGVDMNRKMLETVVRSTTNRTIIKDPGNHPYYVAGDEAPLTEIKAWNAHRVNDLDIDMSLGAKLAAPAGPFKTGTVVDKNILKTLKKMGVSKVQVTSEPIKHTPSIVGVNLLARTGRDWLANLNTNYIEQGIINAAQNAQSAEIHSYNPTGPWSVATRFGKGEEGKY